VHAWLEAAVARVEGLERELREDASVRPETLEYLSIVVRECYRAKEIATRLLRLGHHESRKSEPVFLAQAAEEVALMLAFEAGQHEVSIDLGLGPDLPSIHGDPAEWRHVFFDLIRNALDGSDGEAAADASPCAAASVAWRSAAKGEQILSRSIAVARWRARDRDGAPRAGALSAVNPWRRSWRSCCRAS